MREITVKTSKRCQMINIDGQISDALKELGAADGIAMIFCPHTTAGLCINENTDPAVCHDILADLERMVPHNMGHHQHSEGNSDAHLKSILAGASLMVPVVNGALNMGVWQSVWFMEFDGPRIRRAVITFIPNKTK